MISNSQYCFALFLTNQIDESLDLQIDWKPFLSPCCTDNFLFSDVNQQRSIATQHHTKRPSRKRLVMASVYQIKLIGKMGSLVRIGKVEHTWKQAFPWFQLPDPHKDPVKGSLYMLYTEDFIIFRPNLFFSAYYSLCNMLKRGIHIHTCEPVASKMLEKFTGELAKKLEKFCRSSICKKCG